MSTRLLLAAEDAEDLEIISARLQDAVAPIKDFVYLPRKRRFAVLVNRFKWEDGKDVRVRSRLHFDGVLSVKSRNVKRGTANAVVSLLAIRFTPNGSDDPSGQVELVLSGGGAIQLAVESIDAGLADVGEEWAARGRPSHGDA
jgi:hypothetical protein